MTPLDVTCPTCGAEPRVPCQWPRNFKVEDALYHCDPHRSRVALALDQGMNNGYRNLTVGA